MSTSATPVPSGKTPANLQAAFQGESNAHVRYVAFAKQADVEGYHRAASLFRAAARAEQIHAANHAGVIRKLGLTPSATIETPVVKSTRENLQAAIAGETYERDIMYPNFIREAEAEKNPAALRTFQHALEAETEHARLYTEAHKHLEQMKTAATYFVCAVCGYTCEELSFARCPVCMHPKEKFEAIQ